jgi:dTDP-4-amino-4,6-dideoxygalactose transaminase
MINVTKTYLPALEKYQLYLKKIWENGWLTNNGELVKELENRLADYFGTQHCILVSNGTLALQLGH